MKTNKKKIIGLSCGRKDGNCEILLKEACLAAEELGIYSEIIRAMDLKVKPCKGCESCSIAFSRGRAVRCAIEDDDVQWILEKIVVEDCGLIVSVPVYFLRSNGYFLNISERILPVIYRHPEVLKKNRVGAIISVGGGPPERTPLGLTMANILVQHTRTLVDQAQVNFLGQPRAALMNENALKRARILGQNVARAMMMPIEEATFVGDETAVACPVCHCNIIQVSENLPSVVCPVCWVRGVIVLDGEKMQVKWNEEDIENPRLSEHRISAQLHFIARLHGKSFTEDQHEAKGKIKKYISFDRIIKP